MADAGDVRRMQAVIARVRAAGVVVREMPGWETRGATWARAPRGVVDHHDASTIKSGEWGALGIIVAGREGIPGPLSQFQVARCLDGVPKVAVVAAGRANHAGKGGPSNVGQVTVPVDSGNSWLYGIEKANNGVGEPYTVAALYALTAVTSAVADVCGVPRGDSVIGHKEWAAGRKTDPQYRMWRCREETAAFTPGRLPTPPPGTPVTPVTFVGLEPEAPPQPQKKRTRLMYVVKDQQGDKHYLVGPGFVTWIPTIDELQAAVALYGEPVPLNTADITHLQTITARVQGQVLAELEAAVDASEGQVAGNA